MRFFALFLAVSGVFVVRPGGVLAAPAEVVIGNTGPYSGPFSPFAMGLKAAESYFKVHNDSGLSPKIRFISLDDGWNPQKALQQGKKLVERDKVFLMFLNMGTVPVRASQGYFASQKVPQVFFTTGASILNRTDCPLCLAGGQSFHGEAALYAHEVNQHHAKSKVAVIYQNDDYGKDMLSGFKEALADKTKLVRAGSYEAADVSLDAQLLKIYREKPEILVSFSTPKFAAMTMKKLSEWKWKPVHFLNMVSTSQQAVMSQGSEEITKGTISSFF